MATNTTLDASDSRTSSVGRKRTLQQATSNLQAAGASHSSDSDGDQPSGRSQKRSKLDDNGKDEDGTIPQQSGHPTSGAEGDQNSTIENSKDIAAAAMSWNKGIQATVRTSLGGSLKLTKKSASNEKQPMSQNQKEEPNNEVQPSVLGDTSTPDIGNASQADVVEVKMTRAQKRAQSALEVAERKKSKGDTKVQKSVNQEPVAGTDVAPVEGDNLTLPAPRTKKSKEKPAAFVVRDLRTNFVPQLLTKNSNAVGKMDLKSIMSACEAYVNKHYSVAERKPASIQLKDASFHGFCRNRLKEAQSGTAPTSKPVSAASSVSGRNVEVMSSTTIPTLAPIGREGVSSEIPVVQIDDEGQEEKDESSSRSKVRGKKKKGSSKTAPMIPDTAQEGGGQSPDDYSPKLETVELATSSRVSEQHEELMEVSDSNETDRQKQFSIRGMDQINRYYPSLPNGSSASICLTCGEDGHSATSCPQLKCSSCGLHGVHFTNSCPQTIRCTKCHQRGHQKANCPEKLAITESEKEPCDTCGSQYHTEQFCHFLWRSYKPDSGSVRKVRNLLADCYNCGSDSHFGPECALCRSSLLTGGYTWSMTNRDRYVDSKSSLYAISLGKDYVPPKQQNGFSIKGSARSNPVTLDDSDEEEFIRPKIAPPPKNNNIRFGGRPSLEERTRPPPPPPSRYREPLPNYYRPNNESARYGRERSFSPPPRYPDYNQRGHDDEYHTFDSFNDRRPLGEPLMPFRGNSNQRGGGQSFGGRGGKANNEPFDSHNVPPPQSLAGKKNSRRSHGKGGGARGGAARGAANRGRK